MAYLTISGRNDYVSNLASANNSIFYPSASLSIIPTQMIPGIKSQGGLNYLKLRAGYGICKLSKRISSCRYFDS